MHLTDEEKKILILFGDDPFLDLDELSERTNIDHEKLKEILDGMIEKGLLGSSA